MSPQGWALVVVVAIFTFVVARVTVSKPEPKRFGLEQAEAAAQYVSTADAARPVLGVVVGVLGYENAVIEDLAMIASDTSSLNDGAREEIADNDQKITELKRTIAQLQLQVANRDTELAAKKRIAALFTAA